jgi:hypothetical protein
MTAFEHGEIASVALSGAYAGRPFVNVLHFRKRDLTDFSLANLAALEALLAGASGTNTSILHFWQSLDAQCIIDTIKLRTDQRAFPKEYVAAVTLAGSSVNSDLMPTLAILAKFSSAYATRRFRGRLYLPGVNDGMIDSANGGIFSAALRTTLATRLTEFLTAWAGHATYEFVIYSRLNDEEDTVVSPAVEVLGANVMKQFAIQRRRRGAN